MKSCNLQHMNGPGGYYAKWNKSDREIVWFHLHIEPKKWTNITKWKQSHRYKEQTDGCQRGGWWGDERKRWGRWKGTNFQSQNKWVTVMKCSVGNRVNNYVISFMVTDGN